MTEVEKLYELAGVEVEHTDECVLADKYWNNEELANEYETFDNYLAFNCPHQNDACYADCEYAYDKYIYPPFTAEKQIAILQLLTNRKGYPDYETWGQHFDCFAQFYNFPDALAKMVNALWQDLTEAEQNEIKNILKG